MQALHQVEDISKCSWWYAVRAPSAPHARACLKAFPAKPYDFDSVRYIYNENTTPKLAVLRDDT